MKILHIHFKYTRNKGDESIVLAIRDQLKKTFSNLQYTSKYLYYIKDLKYPKLVDNKLCNLPIVKNTFEKYKKYIPQKILKYLDTFLIKLKTKNSQKLVNLINQQDLIIIGGGGVFGKNALPFNLDIIQKIKTPTIIYSAGLNKFIESLEDFTPKENRSIQELLNIASLITVRDSNTKKFLEKLDPVKDIEILPDPAIFLEAQKFNLKTNQKSLKVGLNLAFHIFKIRNEYADYLINLFSDFCFKINLQETAEFIYFAHSNYEAAFAKKLKTNLEAKNINLKILHLPPKKLKYAYSKVDFVINMMLHSCIFAFSENTPFINILYDQKNLAFLTEIDYKYSIRLSKNIQTENLLSQFYKLKQEKSSVKKSFQDKKSQLRAVQKQFLLKLKKEFYT